MCGRDKALLAKIVFIVVNVVLIVCGVTVVSTTRKVQKMFGTFASVVGQRNMLNMVSWMVSSLAALVAAIAICGCVGVVLASRRILRVYCGLLLGVLSVTLFLGVVAVMWPSILNEWMLYLTRKIYDSNFLVTLVWRVSQHVVILRMIRLAGFIALLVASLQVAVLLLARCVMRGVK